VPLLRAARRPPPKPGFQAKMLGGNILPSSEPTFAPSTQQSTAPTALWGSFRPPLPTNAWWTNLVTGVGDQPVFPLPYAVRATAKVSAVAQRHLFWRSSCPTDASARANFERSPGTVCKRDAPVQKTKPGKTHESCSCNQGVTVSHTAPTVTATDVIYPFVADLSLGFSETASPRCVFRLDSSLFVLVLRPLESGSFSGSSANLACQKLSEIKLRTDRNLNLEVACPAVQVPVALRPAGDINAVADGHRRQDV